MAGADFNQRQHDQRQVAAAKYALCPFAATAASTGAAVTHAVATLIEAARTATVQGVFAAVLVAMLAVMVMLLAAMAVMTMVTILAAVAVFCVV